MSVFCDSHYNVKFNIRQGDEANLPLYNFKRYQFYLGQRYE